MSEIHLHLRQACWIASNIMAGSAAQVEAMCVAGFLTPLIDIIINSGDRRFADKDKGEGKVKREATWALSNLTAQATPGIVALAVENGLLLALVTSMKSSTNDTTIHVALDGVRNVLRSWKPYCETLPTTTNSIQDNTYLHLFVDCGGAPAITALQGHTHPDVQRLVSSIMKEFLQKFLWQSPSSAHESARSLPCADSINDAQPSALFVAPDGGDLDFRGVETQVIETGNARAWQLGFTDVTLTPPQLIKSGRKPQKQVTKTDVKKSRDVRGKRGKRATRKIAADALAITLPNVAPGSRKDTQVMVAATQYVSCVIGIWIIFRASSSAALHACDLSVRVWCPHVTQLHRTSSSIRTRDAHFCSFSRLQPRHYSIAGTSIW
jgi:hypothetical protein